MPSSPAARAALAARDAEVARLTRAGLTATQIGWQLGVSTRAVTRAHARLRAAAPPAPPPPPRGGSDWQRLALCRDEDPELFFPVGTTGPAAHQAEEAKAVCRRCAVIGDCLSWALESRQPTGIFGGLDEAERRELRRRELAGAA